MTTARRPSDDRPSTWATRSSGTATRSFVEPRTKSPGWRTNSYLGDVGLLDVLFDLLRAVRVDTGDVRALELQELRTETEVDARRLDLHLRVRERVDPEVARLQSGEDVRVREDHGGVGAWEAQVAPGVRGAERRPYRSRQRSDRSR
jgi:hypothetical protein